jgi:hypothetical protein
MEEKDKKRTGRVPNDGKPTESREAGRGHDDRARAPVRPPAREVDQDDRDDENDSRRRGLGEPQRPGS